MAKLRSTQIAKIVDLWSEGEIVGLVDGAKSIYFDETVVQNPDGSFNFENVKFDVRTGTNDQTFVKGYGSVESDVQVGTKILKDSPVTRSVTNTEADSVRISISLPALYRANDEGGLENETVRLKVDVSDNGGAFVPVRIGTDKTTDKLIRNLTAYTIPVTCDGFDVGFGVTFTPSKTGDAGYWTGRVEYKKVADSAWTTLREFTVTEAESRIQTASGTTTRTSTRSASISGLELANYQVRLVTVATVRGAALFNSLVYETASFQIRINGVTQSKYIRSYEFPTSGTGPWNYRVTRLTDDNDSSKRQNDTFFEAITTIIDAKLRYPNSAYIAIELDAQKFDNIPGRAYDVKLLKVKVPTNYNPDTRTYSGVWDGTFKTAWTDNPAWCYYDLCTNSRYGLGGYLNVGQIDKWALYSISQYCDELVSDGFDGREPRFTCNAYIQSREEAYRVLQDIASVFRAISYWDTGTITLSQDAPSDAIHLFTNSNIVDGNFNYSGSASKARHTVALVTWNDPDDMYRQKVEYVADDEAIARFGVIETELVAFACTSRGQANRVGRWLLYSERFESDTVTFVTGLEGITARPGAIIKVADSHRAGTRLGGRVSSATVNNVTLDAAVTLNSGTNTIMVMLPDGSVESRTIFTVIGKVVHVSEPFTQAPNPQSQWVISANDVEAQTFRIISVQEQEGLQVQITALKHDSQKYDYVENGLALQTRNFTTVNVVPDTPINVSIIEGLYQTKNDVLVRVSVAWDLVVNASKYRVVYSVDDGNDITLPDTDINTIDILDAVTGTYTVKVYAIGPLGNINEEAGVATHVVLGKTAPPSNVTNLTYVLDPFIGLTLYWDKVADVDIAFYEVRVGTSFDSGESLGQIVANNLPVGLLPVGTETFYVKALDTTGNYSTASASVTVTVVGADAPTITTAFAGDSIVLNWTAEQGSLATQAYEIRYGETWAGGTSVGQIKGTTASLKATWSGNRKFWVAAVDANNNYGEAGSVTATVNLPVSVSVTSEVVDNNVLLRWGDATATLPIDYYEIRRGASFAAGAVIGRVSARFTAIFESTGGGFTYWIQPVDVAGNQGALSSVFANVTSPPDYQLLLDVNSTFNGTKTNFVYEENAGGFVTPVNATETFQQHFVNNSFTTPQGQITAGYPYYVQPIGVNGAYEEVIDYGQVISSTKISTTITYNTISGSVAVTPTISFRKLLTDPWTNISGQNSIFATDFRYVKIKYDFVPSTPASFVVVSGLNVKFDIKLKNDAGTASVLAADSGGTTVNFNVSFIDVSSITVTPLATTPRIAVYDFNDVANPTSFKILLYDTSGNRINGTVGWSVKGV